MEYLELFDEANLPLGQLLPRRQVHEQGHWHRTAQIFIWHPQLGFLCHQRSKSKDLFPSLWDVSIGGHLNPHETYLSCATRELKEELGIEATPQELHHIATMSIDGQDVVAQLLDREHAGIFLYQTSSEATAFDFQKEEIEEVAYLTAAQLKKDLTSKSFSRTYIPLQQQFLYMLHLIEAYLQKQ
ncbi:NUDIX hydrolase [Rufibacter roseus]|uniref:NUDIX domain-containing protein n=1 Tax=Rufibacter roseus TaxID=1567108 RepID=A0ABW2DII4_9BACT|nr:NUDIX domain-containing protein [Rufibacter roseus]